MILLTSTVSGNTATVAGGGIFKFGGVLTLDAGSSVSGNVPDDCVGC